MNSQNNVAVFVKYGRIDIILKEENTLSLDELHYLPVIEPNVHLHKTFCDEEKINTTNNNTALPEISITTIITKAKRLQREN